MKLEKIKGIYVIEDKYNAARKTKILEIKKVIDLANEMVASIGIGKYETINEYFIHKYEVDCLLNERGTII